MVMSPDECYHIVFFNHCGRLTVNFTFSGLSVFTVYKFMRICIIKNKCTG